MKYLDVVNAQDAQADFKEREPSEADGQIAQGCSWQQTGCTSARGSNFLYQEGAVVSKSKQFIWVKDMYDKMQLALALSAEEFLLMEVCLFCFFNYK